MNLSGGLYTYNRFDAFEKSLEEGEAYGTAMKNPGSSSAHDMKAKVDAAAMKKKKEGEGLKKAHKKQEMKQEKETMDEAIESRSKMNEAAGQHPADDDNNAKKIAARIKMAQDAKKKQSKMDEGTTDPEANRAQRKLNKDENNSKLKVTKAVMEQEQRMAMYSRALGVMGAHYSVPKIEEKKELPDFIKKKKEEADEKKNGKSGDKKADKDYDGDGEVESSSKEHAGSVHNAIQKAKGGKPDGKDTRKEEVELTKEDVVQYLVDEGYASNEVSAEILHTHVSDEFLEEIEQRMISEMGPAYPSETKAQAKAQSDHRMGKSSAGLKTGKNPGPKMSHTSGANKQEEVDYFEDEEGNLYIIEGEADKGVSGDEAMKRHGIKKHEGPMKVTKLKAKKGPKGSVLKPTRYKGKTPNVRDVANNDRQ